MFCQDAMRVYNISRCDTTRSLFRGRASAECPAPGTGWPQEWVSQDLLAGSTVESERERSLSSWNRRLDGRREMGRAAEMEDAPDLKSGDPMGHVGSTPTATATVPTE